MTLKSFITKSITTAMLAGGLSIGLVGAAAGTPIESGSGTATCELNTAIFGTTACALQTVTPHAAWQQPGVGDLSGSGALWVSYANTGSGGGTLALTPDNTSPTPGDLSSVPWLMKVSETFTVGAAGGSILLQVWADDTAAVYFNGVLRSGANFSQDACADGPIGCESNEYFLLDETLAAGIYSLDFYVYQLGIERDPNLNPFGLLYSGNVASLTPDQVPEPGGLGLLGLGLLGLSAAARRRRR